MNTFKNKKNLLQFKSIINEDVLEYSYMDFQDLYQQEPDLRSSCQLIANDFMNYLKRDFN